MRKKPRSKPATGRNRSPSGARTAARGRSPIGRRSFVKTAGGILLATGLGSACAGSDSDKLGTIVVNITGLGSGLVDGGTAVVTSLDDPTLLPVSITVPASGSGTGNVKEGNYHAVYQPPNGYQVVGGITAFDIPIEQGKTYTLEIQVSVIVVTNPQGTISVQVTGLTGAAASGGTATLLRTDIAGQSPLSVPVPVATGTVDTVVAVGTYRVSYLQPSNFSVNVGVQNGIVVAANATATVPFVVTLISGNFTAGDILNNASFETNYSGLEADGGGTPYVGSAVTALGATIGLSTADKYNGSQALRIHIPVDNDTLGPAHQLASLCYNYDDRNGQNGYVKDGTGVDRLFARFWFKLDQNMHNSGAGGNPSLILKFQINFGAFFTGHGYVNAGGFELRQNQVQWLFGGEWNSAGLDIVSLNAAGTAWHSLEFDYWFKGHPSGFAAARLWYDNVDVSIAAPTPPAPGHWGTGVDAGWLIAGSRSANNTGPRLGRWWFADTLNRVNNTAVNLYLDRVSLSTLGRVGP